MARGRQVLGIPMPLLLVQQLALTLLLLGQLAVVSSQATTSVSSAAATAAATQPPESKCLCQTSSCLCCIELNLTTSIDLGGPACVNVRQQERNVSLNLSYADNPVHNATIKIEDAALKPTCMNLLSDLAQICAKFISMRGSGTPEQGHDGCLVIEPALLSTAQATYPVGCFNFNQGQVRQIKSTIVPVTQEAAQSQVQEQDSSSSSSSSSSSEEEEEEEGLNADELIAAVSASAEQGIALFSQWLGLNLAPKIVTNNSTSRNDGESESATKVKSNVANANRHSRTISFLFDNEDKSDERFKQLLSAQDNIMKESARIGEQSSNIATAFLYSQPDADEARKPSNLQASISPENLAVVPTESRRGGRAYNIHQHVNEV